MYNFATLLVSLSLIVSCNKGHNYTISGKIVEDCNGNIPVANAEFTFKSRATPNLFQRKNGLNKTITTDENGYFEFVYNSKRLTTNGIYIAGLFDGDEYPRDFVIKAHENIDLGNFPINNSFPFTINLIANNAYTANDTLFVITEMKDTMITIPGPFSNFVYGPFTNGLHTGKFEYKDKVLYQGASLRVLSTIILNPTYTGTGNNKRHFSKYVLLKMCSDSKVVFNLVID